jgi:hypothetical protein
VVLILDPYWQEAPGAEIQPASQQQQSNEQDDSAEQRRLLENICPQRRCGERPHESVCDGGSYKSPPDSFRALLLA